ncbi:endonuclease G, mitochondrial-like [Rhinichthys klamathensis goyatoka]|uniref:endonuclease G, mitochondrial-like n=1 Tax=Rhinichthys klamathensis goyatoka TaxID=3034132 RepID=UPI0024B4CFFE|nr:endonuclease G, mitochondrial-like [Rhinichthys klamathensis goyatoka]
MNGDASTCINNPETVKNGKPIYKLIDRAPNLAEIIQKKSYALLYDNRTRNAAWVYEILNTSTLSKEYKKKQRPFFEVDNSVHPFYRAKESGKEFIGGYDRGHLAAAANHRWCQEAFEDTFSISNMTPQHESLNGPIWSKLEEDCREKILERKSEIRNVHVYTGPLYLPRNDDSNEVCYRMITDKAVPTHFFKVVILENKDDTVELKCYKVPNEELAENDLEKYIVEIEYIESISGLIFRENGSNQGEIDSERTVTWEGNGCVAESKVKISTPRTNNIDRADI